VFVPKVDFVSLAGWPERPNGDVRGPELVVSPLATMDFTGEGVMRLVSLHAGVTLDEVRDNTGFELVVPEVDAPTTPHPTTQEMLLMRGFDLDGLLAIVV
jgi:hypothetical protein